MNRDTQFEGFAARLLQDLLDQGAYVAISEWATGGDSAKSEQLIAQRAYDLVQHSVSETTGSADISHVPDMTTWPERAN